MKDFDIKKIIYSNRNKVKELMVTEHQLKIIHFIKSRGEITTPDLVKYLDCSIQSASATLARLHARTWLARKEVVDPTGGVMFVYWAWI